MEPWVDRKVPGKDFVIRNKILHSLRPAAQDFMSQRLITRDVAAGEILWREGDLFTHVVFPHEGVLSLMAIMQNGRSVEKASIGLEGFLGFSMLMGERKALGTAVVQVPGHASWLSLTDLDEAMTEFVCVRETMLRYAQSLIVQTMESVACNSLHTAEQRVTRWLLHAHDRVTGDRFMVTQQAVAEVLGLRRATVSEICSHLQNDGVLDYARGVMSVVDRRALQNRTCECYDRIRQSSLL